MRRFLNLIFIKVPIRFLILSVIVVLLLKWIPIKYTPLMAKRAIEFRSDDTYSRHQDWIPIEMVSSASVKAIIAAEDSRFLYHNGFERGEIRNEFERFKNGEKNIRGCSTISQQTAKNVFTFGSNTWIRKGFETWFTVLIEKIWGKKRIMEVYLNVAEMGKGIYGIQAAAGYYFDKDAAVLKLSEASSLAICLPSPLNRSPDIANKHYAKRKDQITNEANNINIPWWRYY